MNRTPYLALVVAAFQVIASHGASLPQPDRAKVDAVASLLLLVGPAMMLFRRRFPATTLGVTLVATCLYLLGGYPYGPVFTSPIILLFQAVAEGRRKLALVAAGLTTIFFLVYSTWLVSPPPSSGLWHVLAIVAVMALILAAGELARYRREGRAERARVAEEESRRQASEERLTMAQELHDVLAHNISLIHVQASTALHLMDDDPSQARSALTTIKSASKEVLGELRSVLNVLREGAPRSPTAGLDRLTDLVERSGLDVSLEQADARALPAQVERAAYRIVQESLTNAARHAPGSRVSVRLDYLPAELVITVADTGSSMPAVLAEEGSGNGIPGMRERAAALGGTLVARPAGTGFRVEARLPLPEETQ
ncbi:sensor histidine kinase [Nonomuraea sp. NPDC059194]|uniref:sensor histidine kinase n=1 Tax=Nonomuraea sp. NPDC059194 TaxID=3346764 RepID=UPI00368497BB